MLRLPTSQGRFWRSAALAVALWTAVGLCFSTQNYVHWARVAPKKVPWIEVVRSTLPDWYLWGALAPVVAWTSRRILSDRRRLAPAIAWHLAAGLFFAAFHLVLAVTFAVVTRPPPDFAGAWQRTMIYNFGLLYHWNVVTYAAIAAIYRLRDYFRLYVEGKTRAWQLESQLALAQCQALQMQLRPHFLFNALNAAAELIHERPAQAEEMLLKIADLLRRSLRASGKPEVSLNEELDFVRAYLSVESARFGDRLRVDYDIDPTTKSALVPNLLLQPLVENAVRHGLSGAGGGAIEISSHRERDELVVEVRDNGRGLAPSGSAATGVGLTNTRERLGRLYGERGGLEFAQPAEGGVHVRVRIPFRAAGATPEPVLAEVAP